MSIPSTWRSRSARVPAIRGCPSCFGSPKRASFAESIARHFDFETTFSAAALAAPAFVGLSRFAGSRGRVAFADQEFAVGEVVIAEDGPLTRPPEAILIAVSREGGFAIAHDFAELDSGDRGLVVVPLAPFKAGKDTLAAAAERFVQSS